MIRLLNVYGFPFGFPRPPRCGGGPEYKAKRRSGFILPKAGRRSPVCGICGDRAGEGTGR